MIQFHFHGPSEHTVGGKNYPLEMHLVHKSDAGEIAVVGVLISQGAANAALQSVIANLPTQVDKPQPLAKPVDLAGLLPRLEGVFRYNGSLTTPPCTEGVKWNILMHDLPIGVDQLSAITGKFKGPNNRPIQALKSREIVLDVAD